MKPRIVFLHIPKTAGTTLMERYRHNDNFCAIDYGEPVTDNTDVIFGHSTEFRESARPCVYVTALRDPVDRLMSQYNFVKTQLYYMNGSVELDFYSWFINRDQFRPMAHLTMYDHLNMANLHDGTRVWKYRNMYSNKILHWDGEKTVIDWDYRNRFNDIKRQIDQENLQWFSENTDPKISHYIFTHQDIISEFEKICKINDINFNSIKDITRTNETSVTMKFQGIEYTRFEELNEQNKQLVHDELEYEIKFYKDKNDKI